ncbi:hypothetical protein KCU65_g5217, partial [Aureobasidium melanogenum]
MSDVYELTSLRSRSPQGTTHGRSPLVAQPWYRRITANILSAIASWQAASHTRYNLLSNIDDTDDYGRFALYAASHFLGRLRIRHLIWIVLVTMPSLVVMCIILVAVLYPSYSHPPHHYNVLRLKALRSTDPGRVNPYREKVFIASSIYDKQGKLASGPWAQNLLDLVDLLGPENVFLSIFEDDPDNLARASLEQFSKQLECNSSIVAGHVDRAALPHIELPTGERRLKRIEFLAHVRNRALAPLEDPKSPAYLLQFDKLLYVNDVVFDPIDAANLIFSTNMDENGKAKYHAACAADFINPFKYYDTFATRDFQGNRIGVPIYPWFSGTDDSDSRRDVLDQKDAVRVRSCWGGMTVFNSARWFQTNDITDDSGVADLTLDHNMTSSRQTSQDIYNHTTIPIRFRANPDTYWDASECCLIHADLEAAVQRSNSSSANIYLNPYIRVAYSSSTSAYLHISRRFERLFAPLQKLLNASLGLPVMNSRRIQEVGEQYEDVIWKFDDPAWNVSGNMSGGYRNITRVALPGGFCGLVTRSGIAGSSTIMATVRTFFSTNAALRATPRQTIFHQLRNKGGNAWQKQHSRTYANGFGRGGGYQYSRFQQAGGLMRRWAARRTFYYEVGGLAGACGGFYIYNLEVVPVSGRRRFNIVSASTEQQSGQELYQQVVQEYQGRILPPSHPQHKLVQRVLNRLIPHSGLPAETNNWEVHVIRDEQKNAFVIPGGKVFVFSGILDVCQGEAGLAAVLGHEIAHNVAHHSAERMSSYAVFLPVAIVASLLLGLGDIGNVFTRMVVDLAFLRPGSRKQESEADYIGLMMMAQACYDPSAAVGLWSRMHAAEHDAPPEFISTHPSSHNRMEKIQSWLGEAEMKREQSGCGQVSDYANQFRDTFSFRWS